MDPIPEALRREVNTYFSFLRSAETDRAIDARTFHVTATFDETDFQALSARLREANSSGSFSIIARDLPNQASIVDFLSADGHEIALHGYRHTSFEDVSYATAYEELSSAFDLFDDYTSVRPTGFHAAFMNTSPGTARAASELGIEWVLGRSASAPPQGVTFVEPVSPWDTRLLEAGEDPRQVFGQLSDAVHANAVFLCHPNLHEYYTATDAFDEWVTRHQPTTVTNSISDEEPGMVLDCVKPIQVQ